MEKELSIQEALDSFPDNPQAAGMALAGVLLQKSSNYNFKIMDDICESQKQQIEKLEEEVEYWKHLGKKYLMLRSLLADDDDWGKP